MAKEIESLALMDIAPPSIAQDKNVQNLFSGIDPNLMQVSEAISEAFIISRIPELPEPVLDLLAWQWHVDFYELSQNIEAKRSMVMNSIAWHRKKGTRWAILQALEMLGVEAKFTSWQDLQDEGAEPYTFVIDAKITPDFWQRIDWTKPTQTIRRAIELSKATRSWMSRLHIYQETSTDMNIYAGGAINHAVSHDVDFVYHGESDAAHKIFVDPAINQGIEHKIGLKLNSKSQTENSFQAACFISYGVCRKIDAVDLKMSTQAAKLLHAACLISYGIYREVKAANGTV